MSSLSIITYLIAGIGSVLLGLQVAIVLNARTTRQLKYHRSTQAGVSDLLNYAATVKDGTVVCKNGAFLAAWIYRGEDNASATDDQRNQVSVRINQALASLGSGWMIHVDAVRHPATAYPAPERSAFPDRVSAAIDEERRRRFEHLGTMFEGHFVLSATYFPPLLAQAKFQELMFDDDAAITDDKARTRALIQTFEHDCQSLEDRLSSAVHLTRLRGQRRRTPGGTNVTDDALLSWLHFCITGIQQPIQLPNAPMYLDALLGGQELYAGVVPKIGDNFIQVVAIESFPLESTPGMLSILSELPCEYRWSSRLILMDTHDAVSHLEKFRKKWKQKVRGFMAQVFNTNAGTIDQDAINMVADAEASIADVNSGFIAQGYFTSVVVLMDAQRERVEQSARVVLKAIHRLGFAARIETINTMDAYLGSLPGHGVENVRRPLLNTMNIADMLPTSTTWTGLDHAPCPLYPPDSPALLQCVTSGATPFRLNLHVRDVGHTFLFGLTGGGKSTLLSLIAAQLRRYRGMSIYAFDKGMSMYPLVKAVGGQHYMVASDDNTLAFCPLQYLDTKGDRAWANEWIDTILRLNGLNTTPDQRNEIDAAITSMHDSGSRTLSEFSVTIQDEAIRDAIKPYTIDGPMGTLLDAHTDGLSLTDFTVFEIEDLMNLGEKYALPTLLYLFRRIECSLSGQPSVIILDEAWLMLGHAAFRAKIREWLKVLRKANCLVLMATQSLSDAVSSGILDVIVESTATRIYLPNPAARDDDAAALYRRMGLNSRELEILASAVPKRDYYYVSENGRRLFNLALGPLALAFVGASDKESVSIIRGLEAQHGPGWVDYWLESRGLKLSDYEVSR
ncbi:VirB4 family type IV secretion/conjugal transfer ATPase [uncultured Thiodictyon sp.]|uniref:VirB4 family type IV secretion/conjugal transfer ATPase n=1 Tax=uncultured Thiodictyon sp. TaxID=1846217 RepID=UPI0025E3328F|nr:VirB4 family type IV secretion/conjugal transfer ATPase [uncultured Thiodictyon sp.]